MITSSSNKQIKYIAQLNKKAKVRNEDGVFLVEGWKMFVEAPRDWILSVFLSESFYLAHEDHPLLEGISVQVVEDRVFKSISDTQTPQGILCVMKQPSYQLEDLLNQKNPLLMVLENLQDPGNLGTILRTGEGAGVDGMILSRHTVDIFNPKVIRSTMGSIYRMPFIYADIIETVLPVLKEKGIKTYAAHLKGKAFYDEYSYIEGTAFFIGNEGNGLSDEVARCADTYIKIPMHGQVESLNAAVASSIFMYEACRQRR
ncbi:MAG TPA: RNA methyltransferase [Candidatus Merdenecus merdavium]|nr:RNA methyltransferase [Candidatus Merdenecus merdavium]